MGFLKTCLDFLSHAAFTSFSPFDALFSPQQPLFVPTPPATYSAADFAGAYSPRIDPVRDCVYPALRYNGYKPCNNVSRTCWQRRVKFKDYDINDDYEVTTPFGITREYWLTVDQADLRPDGQPKINRVALNGTYPGPIIEACWGDKIVVHVRNKYRDNGTTIHWHGLRQLYSNDMDGVNGVTQCPIAYGEEYTYEFRARQYGHTWYHSHYSLQYPDGVAGPLIIHGPTSAEWDIDNGPIMVADWLYNTSFAAFNCEAYDCGNETPPKADNIVVNGIGAFKQSNGRWTNNYFKTMFKPGKKHLLRLINGSAASSFVFSIDNHTMTVIASDLVAIKPYTTTSLLLGIGQRYTVVVEANQEPSLYWMRTTPAAGCSAFRKNQKGEFTQVKETTSFIAYEGAPKLPYPDSTSVKHKGVNDTCIDESHISQDRLIPIVPWEVSAKPSNDVSHGSFTAGYEKNANPDLYPQLPFKHWLLANGPTSQPLWVNFSMPTILDPFTNPPFSSITRFEQSYGFVYLIVDGSFLFNPDPNFTAIPTGHPIHLHGSDFVILNQDWKPYDPVNSPRDFKFDNPARRDTALLPSGGYLALAFKPDNPGAWLMHCHIAWHASSGLALQLVVRPREIPDYNGDLLPVQLGCESWRRWDNRDPIVQTDSGI